MSDTEPPVSYLLIAAAEIFEGQEDPEAKRLGLIELPSYSRTRVFLFNAQDTTELMQSVRDSEHVQEEDFTETTKVISEDREKNTKRRLIAQRQEVLRQMQRFMTYKEYRHDIPENLQRITEDYLRMKLNRDNSIFISNGPYVA